MYRARLVSADVAAGIESEEVALVDWDDIPWEQLAFPTVVWALAHFHESRGKTDFATYSNPTGDLARMWPPRKPAGVRTLFLPSLATRCPHADWGRASAMKLCLSPLTGSPVRAGRKAFLLLPVLLVLLSSYERSVNVRIGGNHADCSQQRDADARWAGHAHGQSDARILDPRLPLLGTEGRRRADAAHAARRAADRLPRHRRPGRHHGASLPAPLRLAVLRAQRGRRPALRLSRLEIRRRRQLHSTCRTCRRRRTSRTASRPRPTRWSSARASSGPTWARASKRRRCPRSKC